MAFVAADSAEFLLRKGKLPKRCAAAGGLVYTLREKLGSESSEKMVCDGILEDAEGKKGGCALCFASNSAADNLTRERRILQHLGSHPNVIRMLGWVEHWAEEADSSKGPQCLVLEVVKPLGYDLCEVFVQAFQACISVPLSQIKHYVGQVAQGIQHLHAHGVIHRDIKAENVLIEGQHCAKVIDFGLSVCPAAGVDFPMKPNGYMAPELNPSRGDQVAGGQPPVDAWGCGLIVYWLCVGERLKTAQTVERQRKGIFGKLMEARHVHDDAIRAAEALLQTTPKFRWSMKSLQEWAEKDFAGDAVAFAIAAVAPTSEATTFLHRYKASEVPRAFGAQLPATWSDKQLLSLGFAQEGLQVLMVIHNATWKKFYDKNGREFWLNLESPIDKPDILPEAPPTPVEIISVPGASTELKANSWVFFGCESEGEEEHIQRQVEFVRRAFGLTDSCEDLDEVARRKQAIAGLRPFFPEFDAFEFPEHCANAVLGPHIAATRASVRSAPVAQGDGRKEPRQFNALDLRARFEINVVGVARADGSVVWWPGADVVLEQGDKGLIMRVPVSHTSDTEHEPSLPSVSNEKIRRLIDPSLFRACLALDGGAWELWRGNLPHREHGENGDAGPRE